MDQCKQYLWWTLFVLVTLPSITATDLKYTIPEEQPVNTLLGNILNDTDNLQNIINNANYPRLQFTFLTEGNAVTSLFSLDASTGDLRVGPNSTLDRESICPFSETCHIKLDVVVQAPLNELFRKVSVLVVLEDVNDNPPKFPKNETAIDISEAVLPGAYIPLEGASDRDMGRNNSLQSYEIRPPSDAFGLIFRKNLDGTSYLNLIVKDELDHETDNAYSFEIVAKDGGEPPLEGVMIVNVSITDVNDNVPKFTQEQFNVQVDENVTEGTTILKVRATDLDSGENGQISYKLSSHQDNKIKKLFQIDPQTGDLSVTSDLQSEATESYKVIIEAIDHALQPFTTQTVVTITVRDVINSPPKLTVNMLSGGQISEYANIGAAVAHVAVKESDKGQNGNVRCRLDQSDNFSLQGFDLNEYKVIVNKPLDAEHIKQINVIIVCEDAGTPSLSTNSSFYLKIKDENDNAPIFNKDHYSGELAENSQIAHSVLRVFASDIDSELNGQIQYSLGADSAGRFRISKFDGVIRTNGKFDYETQKVYNFTVIATDRGTPPLSATASVSVTILDVNDEHPKFSQETITVTVSEASRAGDIVSIIKAFDFEAGANGELIYFLLNKTPSIPFTLHINGSLVLDVPLDYERQKVYQFKVMAIDKGRPPLNTTTNVVIKVKDENDNAPIITFPNVPRYLVNVTFADKEGTVISRLRVIDRDSGLNGQHHYIITSRNDSGRFDIDPKTGDIFTTKFFGLKDIDLYRLIISVTDRGSPPLADHTTVFIQISKGNGTAAGGQDSSHEQNIMITLTIICVTIVLSATIVLVIVIMRRRDRQKKHHSRNPTTTHNPPSKYDGIPKSNNINGLKSNIVDDVDGGFPVSYDKLTGLDSKSGVNQTKSTNHFMNSNKSTNSLNSLTETESRDPKKLDDLKALQLHQVLLENYKHLQGVTNLTQKAQVGDDVNSDASLETTTSDSGRGGSEEDVYSQNGANIIENTGYPGKAPHINTSFHSHGTQNSYRPSYSRDSVKHNSRKQVTFRDSKSSFTSDVFARDGSSGGKTSPRNIMYAHDPVNNVHQDHRNPGNFPIRHEPYSSSQLQDNDSGHYIPMGYTKPQSKNFDSRPVIPPRRHDSVLSMTTDDGDDRSTTTSGSYTIDTDDRFLSLDFNQYQDVVV